MKNWNTFKKELLKDKEVASEYKALEPKYALISQVIGARIKSGMTQKELAKRIGTKQSDISRLESGNYNPSLELLQKTAKALGKTLTIALE